MTINFFSSGNILFDILCIILSVGFVGLCVFILIKMGKALHRRIKDADIIITILAVLGAVAVTIIVAIVALWGAFILLWLASGKPPIH